MHFNMRYSPLLYILLYLCSVSYSQTPGKNGVSIDLLPQTKLIRTYTADARSHRLQVLKDINDKGFIGSLGGQFPVLSMHALQKELQFSVAASAYTTLNRYAGRGQLINVDFFVDFLFDLKLTDDWKLRGGFGHTSQHLTDDALASGLVAQNYAKDYLQLQTVHTLWQERLMLYGGVYYFDNFKLTDNNVAMDFSRKVMIQAGFEADIYRFSPSLAFYAAGDIKLRQEFDFGNTHAIQAGFKIFNARQKVLRLAYNYLGGYEERGQFYKNTASLNTIGLYFDF